MVSKYNGMKQYMTTFREYVRDSGPNWLFILSYNVASIFRRNTPRCLYSRRLNLFILTKKKIRKYASTRSRAITYYDGFYARANYISKTYFLDQIEIFDGDTIIDCGANMGDLALWLDLQQLKVDYFGFEPNPIDFLCLSLNHSTKNIENCGLWNSENQLSFYVSTEAASSSFIEPPNFTDILSIPTKRLDSLPIAGPIKVLKLEAEGAEPEVLEGAVKILPLVKYVAADVGPERGPTELSTRDDVVKILESHNFSILLENSGHRKTILFVNNSLI
jgi:FkbM family methyltransferase